LLQEARRHDFPALRTPVNTQLRLHDAPKNETAVQSRSIDLGPVDTIPVGEGRAFSIGARTIAVFRVSDGRIYALDNRCPHRAGPLADGIVEGRTVACPLHGRKFDLLTGSCLGPGSHVGIHPAELVAGRMIVRLPDLP
jgi:nitrite reductase (NADH) small subunit